MSATSPLCPICADILTRQNLSELWPYTDTLVRHHLDFDSFRQAVHAKCYICTIIWNSHFTDNKKSVSSRGWKVKKMGWHWHRASPDEGVVSFSVDVYLKGSDDQEPKRATFRLVDCREPKFRRHFSIRKLPSTTSSLYSLGVAYSWYLSCRAMHKSCRRLQRESKWWPTRLLDVGLPGSRSWKLHISATEKMSSPSYMTLSYRWGSDPSLKLTRSSIDELRRGRLIDELPRTFRDAITVVHRFSVRYLWIDSLCIMQDSLEDWERESSTMCDVYANSSCNISAAASSMPSDGLFRDHNNRDTVRPGLVTMKIDSIKKRYYIFDTLYWHRYISKAVLNQRGWVLQERLLAPRVLHFSDYQIFWECFSEQKCEAFAHGIPWEYSLKFFEPIFMLKLQHQSIHMPDAVFELWLSLAKTYTRCLLTNPEDKLPAISGLAHLFKDATGDNYLCGLWRSRLMESLCWRAEWPMKRLSGVYVAPSWSWACGTGPVTWQTRFSQGYTSLSLILDAQVQNASSNTMGRVLGGFIKVQGILLRVSCEESHARGMKCTLALRSNYFDNSNNDDDDDMTDGNRDDYNNSNSPFSPSTSQSQLNLDSNPPFVIATLLPDFEDTDLSDATQYFYCLILHAQSMSHEGSVCDTYLEGLLLQPVLPSPLSSEKEEAFIRIGFFQLHGTENAEKSGVCINNHDGSACLSEDRSRVTEVKIV